MAEFRPYGTDKELDKWVDSEVWMMRAEIARQGYGLDVLINDESANVRYAVAEQGYGMDVLVNDEEAMVRAGVAEQGYGLDVLVNDKNEEVRWEVQFYLNEHDLTLDEWKEQHTKKTAKKADVER